MDTRCHFNVYKKSIRRRIDVLKTLKQRHVSTGSIVVVVLVAISNSLII